MALGMAVPVGALAQTTAAAATAPKGVEEIVITA
jgi:hypothetical protein